MNNKGNRRKTGIFLILLALLLLAVPVQASAKARLSNSSISVLKGRTYTLKVKGTKKKVKWSSANKSVASVNQKGIVTGKKKGKTVITAKVNGKQYRCNVTVKQPVNKIRLNRTSIELKTGKKFTLKATVGPSGASNKGIVWSSSNNKIATVTQKGKVKAVGVGNAVITARAKDGGGALASCLVMVNSGQVLPAIMISPSSLELLEGDFKTLTATGSVGGIVWGTSDSSIASVSRDGTVIGVSAGTATIVAANPDGSQFAYCTVNVVKSESSPSAAAYQFLDLMQQYSQQIRAYRAAGKYVGYSNSSLLTPYTWSDMINTLNTRGISYNNCALMVRMALRDMGRLGRTQNFWGTDGGIHFNSGVETTLRQSCRIIEVHQTPNELLAQGMLLPGDICTWHGMVHTNVYAGNGLWYDAGRGGEGNYTKRDDLVAAGLSLDILKEDIKNDGSHNEVTKNSIYVYGSFGPVASIDMANQRVGYIIRIVK